MSYVEQRRGKKIRDERKRWRRQRRRNRYGGL